MHSHTQTHTHIHTHRHTHIHTHTHTHTHIHTHTHAWSLAGVRCQLPSIIEVQIVNSIMGKKLVIFKQAHTKRWGKN